MSVIDDLLQLTLSHLQLKYSTCRPVAYRAREKLVVRKYVGAQKGSWKFHSNRVIDMTRRKKNQGHFRCQDPLLFLHHHSKLLKTTVVIWQSQAPIFFVLLFSYIRGFSVSIVDRVNRSLWWQGLFSIYSLRFGNLRSPFHYLPWLILTYANKPENSQNRFPTRKDPEKKPQLYPARPKNRNSYNFQKALKLLRQW